MVEEIARVADLAERMRVYLATMAAAYEFYTFGMLCAGYWLLVYALGVTGPREALAAMGFIAVIAISAYVSSTAFPHHRPGSGPRYAASFAIPFAATYAVAAACLLWGIAGPELFAVAWYPALASALLLAHALVERGAAARGDLAAKPYLFSGVAMAATSPLVLAWPENGDLLALALALIAYYAARLVS